jgi:hypothetical protein
MIRSQRGALEADSRRKKLRAGALASTMLFAGIVGTGSLRPTTVAAQSAPAEDPVLLRELVGRIAGDGSGAKATLLVGTLQTVTPALAIPSGWRVVGAVVRETPNGPPGSGPTRLEFGSNYVDAPTGSATEAISALTKSLTAGGWTVQNNFGTNQGGFVVANSPQQVYAQFCAPSTFLSVNAFKDGTGPVKVSMMANSTPAGLGGPCGSPGSPNTIPAPQIPSVYSQLPRLLLPEKAVLVNSGGGGGSQFSASSGLTIDKADSPTVLEAVFAPQMLEAGWQKSGGASSETASVSTWRKTFSSTPLQATLVIVNAIGGDQRRDLTVTVSQEAAAGGNFPGVPFPALVGPPVMTVVPPVGFASETTLAIASGSPTPIAKASSAASKTKTAVKKTSSTKSAKSVRKK